jgi:hypothetical protein
MDAATAGLVGAGIGALLGGAGGVATSYLTARMRPKAEHTQWQRNTFVTSLAAQRSFSSALDEALRAGTRESTTHLLAELTKYNTAAAQLIIVSPLSVIKGFGRLGRRLRFSRAAGSTPPARGADRGPCPLCGVAMVLRQSRCD